MATPTSKGTPSALPVWIQSLLPQQLINQLAHTVAQSTRPWLVHRLINFWLNRYGVELSEAKFDRISDYRRFGQFFVRQLKHNARSWPEDPDLLACPADGMLGEIGHITSGSLLQAKGKSYQLEELLGSSRRVQDFEGCGYATIYLSPRDYHRVHMPTAGRLIGSQHIAGTLFSVNPHTALALPRLYARNRRSVCLFSSAHGPFAMVLVGALVVGGIHLAWERTPSPAGSLRDWTGFNLRLTRGAEAGQFELGSTVVLIAPRGYDWNNDLRPDTPVRLGQALARLRNSKTRLRKGKS